MADTYFVSLMKDTDATAAVSITMPVFLFFVAFGNIFGVGGSAYISRSMGEGKRKRQKISAFSILLFNTLRRNSSCPDFNFYPSAY